MISMGAVSRGAASTGAKVILVHSRALLSYITSIDRFVPVLLPVSRNVFCQRHWVVYVGLGKQRLDTQEHSSDLQSWTPCILLVGYTIIENIQANPSKLVNVGMIDYGQEPDRWRCHGIFIWKK